jgi:TPR repeat protein
MFGLGTLYAGGHGISRDLLAAQRWFRASAEHGDGRAQLAYGRFLAHGMAGAADPARARLWLERALAQGLVEARADLEAMLVSGMPSASRG